MEKNFDFFLGNIMKNPESMKFREINLSNGAFNRRVGNILGGKNILKEAGFEDELGFYIMKNVDKEILKEWVECLQNCISEKFN